MNYRTKILRNDNSFRYRYRASSSLENFFLHRVTFLAVQMDTYLSLSREESRDDLFYPPIPRRRVVSSTDGPRVFNRSNLAADDPLLLKEIPWKSFRRAPAITSPAPPPPPSLAACNNGTLEDFNAEIE